MDIDRSYEYDEDMHIMKCMQTKTHFDQKRSSLKQNKKPIFNTSRLMENLVEVKQTESLSQRFNDKNSKWPYSNMYHWQGIKENIQKCYNQTQKMQRRMDIKRNDILWACF